MILFHIIWTIYDISVVHIQLLEQLLIRKNEPYAIIFYINVERLSSFSDYNSVIKRTYIISFNLRLISEKSKGTPGIEPGTSRSAVECSTPELYPHLHEAISFIILK